MHVQTRRGVLIALALTVAAAAASADVPATVAFQGYLTDAVGAPVNGTASLEFGIYAALSGGAILWTETQPAVSVAEGIFAVALGSSTPFPTGLFDTAPRFLGIRVNGEPEMPRTELRAAPFALTARSAEVVSEAIELGRVAQPAIFSELTQSTGSLTFQNPNNGKLGVIISTSYSAGGSCHLYEIDPGGGVHLRIALAAHRDGDLAVELPQNAINSDEMVDEPGLASNINTASVTLTGSTPQSMISRTITPPDDGFILALGQSVARIAHTSGTGTSGAVGLSDDGLNFGTAQDMNVIISGNAPGGAYAIPAHVSAVFPATAGVAKTIHLMASEASGDIQLEDLSLTLLYVPTAYGTVTSSFADGRSGQGDSGGAPRGALTSGEIEAERVESQRWNAKRIEREFAEMRAQMEELEHRVAAEEGTR